MYRERVQETTTNINNTIILAGPTLGNRSFDTALAGLSVIGTAQRLPVMFEWATGWVIDECTVDNANTITRHRAIAASGAQPEFPWSTATLPDGEKVVSLVAPSTGLVAAQIGTSGQGLPPQAIAAGAIAIGPDAIASAPNGTALGGFVLEGADDGTAVGRGAFATQPRAHALAAQAVADQNGIGAYPQLAFDDFGFDEVRATLGGQLTGTGSVTLLPHFGGVKLRVDAGQSWACEMMLSVTRHSDGACAATLYRFLAKNPSGTNAALVAAPASTPIANDSGMSAAATITVTSGNGEIVITVTGLAGATLGWNASLRATRTQVVQ